MVVITKWLPEVGQETKVDILGGVEQNRQFSTFTLCMCNLYKW